MARDLSRFLDEVVLEVEAGDDGLRLDHFLAGRIFWRSRTDLQTRIKKGRVLVGGETTKPSARIRSGDRVRIVVTPEDLPDQDPAAVPVDVLHEDEQLVVVNKAPGVIVHPTGRHVYDTLMNALALRYRLSGEADRGVTPHVVHRLDRNTSGVLVVAKTFEAKRALQEEFESRRPRKDYLALVDGVVTEDAGEIDGPLGPDPAADIRLKMSVRPDGQRSLTSFAVVERFAEQTLVRARPHTGRQHQIRVHLASVGHPILADPLYGDPHGVGAAGRPGTLLARQALHAERLRVRHPGRGRDVDWRAPVASDMEAVLAVLRAGETLARTEDTQSARWSRA